MNLKNIILRCLPVTVLALTTAAFAQNQLGDGRRLDNNLQQGSGGRNAPLLQNTAGRYADALVTGNVSGLGAFHGSVGYGSDYSFRGALPSDSVYNFNRISGSGNPAYAVPGSTGMLNAVVNPLSGAGDYTFRNSTGYSAGEITGQYSPYGPTNTLGNPNARYSFGPNLGRSRDITFDQAQAYSAQPLAIGTDANGQPMAINASPLTGVTIQHSTIPQPPEAVGAAAANPGTSPLNNAVQPGRIDAAGSRTLPGQIPAGDENATDNNVTTAASAGARLTAVQVSGERLGAEMNPQQLPGAAAGARLITGYDHSLDQLLGSTTAKPGEDVYADLLGRIRESAEKKAAPNVEVAPENHLVPAPGTPGNNDQITTPPQAGAERTSGGAAPGSSESDTNKTDDNQSNTDTQKQQAIDSIVKKLDYDLPAITSFAGSTQTLYNDAMSEAERYMRSERYFDAQTAYTRAISIQPDKPLAYVGMVNADLGAGLIVPAAHGLRNLFNAHPELIAARYDRPLLPTEQRIAKLNEKLTAYLDADKHGTEGPLLQAYLAYQKHDPQGLQSALDTWAKRDSADPLLPLLRRIWLEPSSASGSPSPDHP